MLKRFFNEWVAAGALIIVVGALIILAPRFSQGTEPDTAPKFDHGRMIIERADGKTYAFSLEIAKTMEQEMYGLMFRKSLPQDSGMLFVYDPDQKVSMWMKNTYIPLDMLFVRADGVIEKIVTHAVPFDLTPIPSDEPVRGVIEINAGEVERRGIKTGDKIINPAFSD